MADPRFYCSEPIFAGQETVLPTPLAHHIRVRRLEAGDTVVLFDGRGGEIAGVLSFEGKKTLVLLGQHSPREAELSGEITLIQALPSGDKMDWIIEKAVELGVHRGDSCCGATQRTQVVGCQAREAPRTLARRDCVSL